jgi:hypothetical protein
MPARSAPALNGVTRGLFDGDEVVLVYVRMEILVANGWLDARFETVSMADRFMMFAGM